MQPFRLSKDARDWFKHLRGEKAFKIDFDIFYFCFLTGIAAQRKVSLPTDSTAELVDYFPGPYNHRAQRIVALFLASELKMLGVAMNDKRTVHDVVSKLISPSSPNLLSDEGVREFNRYAHGGYQKLYEWFDECPTSLETFLGHYKRMMDEIIPSVWSI